MALINSHNESYLSDVHGSKQLLMQTEQKPQVNDSLILRELGLEDSEAYQNLKSMPPSINKKGVSLFQADSEKGDSLPMNHQNVIKPQNTKPRSPMTKSVPLGFDINNPDFETFAQK